MTATPQPPASQPATSQPAGQPTWKPASRWSAGRVVALVFGIVLLLPALALVLGGGVLLAVDLGERTDGYVFSEADDFSTDGFALTSERIDLSTGADWVPLSAALGTARAEVISTAGSEVFVGIAPVDEGAAYLDGVARSVIDDLGTTANDEQFVDGGPPAGAPGDQDFWAAQASGPGTQRLDWEPAEGDWLFVVMNADGSAGIAVDARVGATVPALDGLAWGMLAVGVVLLVVSVLLLVLSIRDRSAVYAGPPPGAAPWTPPAPVDRTTAADARPDQSRTGPPPPTVG
jgi:hypothetical protein